MKFLHLRNSVLDLVLEKQDVEASIDLASENIDVKELVGTNEPPLRLIGCLSFYQN